MRAFLFVVSNISITLSYFFVAAVVAPRVTVKLRRTRIGAIGFFLLCGLHHIENVLHYLLAPHEPVSDVYETWHMLAIDVPQAVFVWMFVTGLYMEIVKWGPWHIEQRQRKATT